MSKGTIISHDGDGLYTIELDHSQAAFEAEETRLGDLIAQNNEDVNEAYTALAAAEFRLTLARRQESAAISSGIEDDVKAATQEVIEATADVQAKQERYNQLKLAGVSLNNRLGILQNIYAGEPEQVQAWCADYNLSLTGNVGVVDVAYEDRITPIIRPAGEFGDEAAYDAGTDGKLSPIQMLTSDSAYNSFALQPGYAKHKPRYRKGKIASIDLEAQTAQVILDTTTFVTQEGEVVDLNKESVVTADVVYMSCNAAAFEVNDRVVVAFNEQDWEQPQVIGFESNPRPCAAVDFLLTVPKFTDPSQQEIVALDLLTFELRERIALPTVGIYQDPLEGNFPNNQHDFMAYRSTSGTRPFEYAVEQWTGNTKVDEEYYDAADGGNYNYAKGGSVADSSYTYALFTAHQNVGGSETWETRFQRRSKAGSIVTNVLYDSGTPSNDEDMWLFHRTKHNSNYIMTMREYPTHASLYDPQTIRNVIIDKSDGSVAADLGGDLEFYAGSAAVITYPDRDLWDIACSDSFYCCLVFYDLAPADVKDYLFVWDSSGTLKKKTYLGSGWKSIIDKPDDFDAGGIWYKNFCIEMIDDALYAITVNVLDPTDFTPPRAYHQVYVQYKKYKIASDGTPSYLGESPVIQFDSNGAFDFASTRSWMEDYTAL